MFYVGFLISSLPFILPFRDYPSGDFYSDACALFIATFAVTFFFKSFSIGREILLFIGLAVLFLLSGIINHGYYYDVWLVSGGVLLIAAAFLSGLIACSPAERDHFFNGCVYGLLFGGGGSLLIGVSQALGVVEVLGEFVFPGGSGVYGNIGQRNMYSTYIICFVSALSWLVVQRKINLWLSVLLLFVAACMMAFAGSRMVLLDSLVLVSLVCWFYFFSARHAEVERFSMLILLFVIFLIFFQFIFMFWNLGGAARISISLDVNRVAEWSKAWSIFIDNPFGVGIGEYARHSFIYQLDAPPNQITWTNAHNIFLHLLVELGIWVLPFFVIGGWLLYVFSVRCFLAGSKGMVVLSCVLMILVHSLLEYPLWYMNFLFLFVSMIAIFGSQSLGRRLPIINLSAFMVGLLILYCINLYVSLPAYRLADRDMMVNVERLAKLVDHSLNPLLAWSADRLLTEYLLEDDGPELDFKLCKSIHMVAREPLYPYLERVALFAMAGQDFDFASRVLKSRYAVYPSMPDTYLRARIRLLWPNYADGFIDKIDSDRLAGFPNHDFYRLELPGRCR